MNLKRARKKDLEWSVEDEGCKFRRVVKPSFRLEHSAAVTPYSVVVSIIIWMMVESVKNGNWADFLSTTASPNIMKGEENVPWVFSILFLFYAHSCRDHVYEIWNLLRLILTKFVSLFSLSRFFITFDSRYRKFIVHLFIVHNVLSLSKAFNEDKFWEILIPSSANVNSNFTSSFL